MKTQRNSVCLNCFWCALIAGLLWFLLARTSMSTPAFASDAVASKQEDQPNKHYEIRKIHSRDGIGKFYMGREIALVMGFPAAVWLERPEREDEEHLTTLVRELKLHQGDVVADIGAGSGVISIMMARDVGPSGKVLAVDIQQPMLDLLGDKIKNQEITNIDLILATEKNPNLKPSSIDLALMVDVYHEFAFPFETIQELSKALRPGGRVAFVEYRLEDPKVPIKLVHKMSEAQIKREISQPEFGLKWKETVESLPRQHIVIFQRPMN